MLKQRLITAAVLIPLVIWALFTLSSQTVLILFALVAALAAWEWLTLIGLRQPVKVGVLLAMELLIAFSVELLPLQAGLMVISLVWLLIALFVIRYAHRVLPDYWQSVFRSPLFGALIAVLIMTGFVTAAYAIHQLPEHGAALLLYVMVSVWLADTGGYFAGKRFGKTPLARQISPNKTWEGVAGALVLSSIWAVSFYLLIDNLPWTLVSWVLFAWGIVAISIVGDLFESVFKRCFQVKDSGQLLPGHGGMLDRIDSLLAAIPLFAALLLSGV